MAPKASCWGDVGNDLEVHGVPGSVCMCRCNGILAYVWGREATGQPHTQSRAGERGSWEQPLTFGPGQQGARLQPLGDRLGTEYQKSFFTKGRCLPFLAFQDFFGKTQEPTWRLRMLSQLHLTEAFPGWGLFGRPAFSGFSSLGGQRGRV